MIIVLGENSVIGRRLMSNNIKVRWSPKLVLYQSPLATAVHRLSGLPILGTEKNVP